MATNIENIFQWSILTLLLLMILRALNFEKLFAKMKIKSHPTCLSWSVEQLSLECDQLSCCWSRKLTELGFGGSSVKAAMIYRQTALWVRYKTSNSNLNISLFYFPWAGMTSSKNGRGKGVVYTVGEGGKVIDRGSGRGRGEQGMIGERGVNGERERGTGRRGRELVCTCSARERIRRSIGTSPTITPPIWRPSNLITWRIHFSGRVTWHFQGLWLKCLYTGCL